MNDKHVYKKNVSDEEIQSMMLPHIAKLLKDVVPRIIIETQDNKTTNNIQTNSVGDKEKELLESIYAEPELSINERAGYLGLSAYMMNNVKKSILNKKLAEQFTVNKGRTTGGNVTLLALTDAGCKAINKSMRVRKPNNVSHEHWWWQRKAFQFYKDKGFQAEIEKAINGKRVDVGISKDGKNIALEIELTPKNALSNVACDIQAGFDFVLSCCRNSNVHREVKKRLLSYKDYETIKDRVEIKILTDSSFLQNS